MALLVEQFARAGSFQSVWEADRWPVLFRSSSAFEILRKAHPERFIKIIEELPHPALVKQCLSSKALLESPRDVLTLLRIANEAFDGEGRWQRSGVAAILLLQMASEQLLSPRDGGEDEEDLTKDIELFNDTATEVVDVLFARSDAAELAWCWLENLLCQIPRLPPAGLRHARKVVINQIGILVHAIASRLAPRRAHEVWIADAPPLARQFRALAILSVLAFTTKARDLDVGLVGKSLLKGSGFELTRVIELIRLPGAPLRVVAGDALAKIRDPALWFTNTWSALRFERERAWRARGKNIGNPAEIMGLWGLGTIESFVTAGRAHDAEARGMWCAVEQLFREARLVEPRLGRDFWSQAVTRLFWWWPQIFPAVAGLADSEGRTSRDIVALGNALAPYAEISGDFMGVIVCLQEGGLTPSELDDAVHRAGQDLLRMICRFVEIARRLDDRRVWNPEWVATLRKLEAAVALHRESSPVTAQA